MQKRIWADFLWYGLPYRIFSGRNTENDLGDVAVIVVGIIERRRRNWGIVGVRVHVARDRRDPQRFPILLRYVLIIDALVEHLAAADAKADVLIIGSAEQIVFGCDRARKEVRLDLVARNVATIIVVLIAILHRIDCHRARLVFFQKERKE